jgi:hypothetical protein
VTLPATVYWLLATGYWLYYCPAAATAAKIAVKTLLSICAGLSMMPGTVTVHAADITGTWTGKMKTPDGNSFSLSFTFKQDADKLTGTVQGPQGDPIDISNGKIDGAAVNFDVSFNGMTSILLQFKLL